MTNTHFGPALWQDTEPFFISQVTFALSILLDIIVMSIYAGRILDDRCVNCDTDRFCIACVSRWHRATASLFPLVARKLHWARPFLALQPPLHSRRPCARTHCCAGCCTGAILHGAVLCGGMPFAHARMQLACALISLGSCLVGVAQDQHHRHLD